MADNKLAKRFEPQHDITAYELAVIVGEIGFTPFAQISKGPLYFDHAQWRGLSPAIARHFVDCIE
jgi:hypothetical protein